MDLKKLIEAVQDNQIEWNKHSLERMLERGIKRKDVKFDKNNDICYVITAYYPDVKHFESDFKTRKRK